MAQTKRGKNTSSKNKNTKAKSRTTKGKQQVHQTNPEVRSEVILILFSVLCLLMQT